MHAHHCSFGKSKAAEIKEMAHNSTPDNSVSWQLTPFHPVSLPFCALLNMTEIRLHVRSHILLLKIIFFVIQLIKEYISYFLFFKKIYVQNTGIYKEKSKVKMYVFHSLPQRKSLRAVGTPSLIPLCLSVCLQIHTMFEFWFLVFYIIGAQVHGTFLGLLIFSTNILELFLYYS